MKEIYAKRLETEFPNLRYADLAVVGDPTEQRLLIDDVSIKVTDQKQLSFQQGLDLFRKSCRGELLVFTTSDLAETMNRRLVAILSNSDPANTILIFPGNSAQDVKNLLPEEVRSTFPQLDIPVRRQLGANMAVSGVFVLTPPTLLSDRNDGNRCIIIDDVIATGATAQAVRDWIDPSGRQEWQATSWMSLSPIQVKDRRRNDRYQSGLPIFTLVETALVYQGLKGTPPNNTLSTFLGTNEKSEAVRTRYIEKYVQDAEGFASAIEQMRRAR